MNFLVTFKCGLWSSVAQWKPGRKGEEEPPGRGNRPRAFAWVFIISNCQRKRHTASPPLTHSLPSIMYRYYQTIRQTPQMQSCLWCRDDNSRTKMTGLQQAGWRIKRGHFTRDTVCETSKTVFIGKMLILLLMCFCLFHLSIQYFYLMRGKTLWFQFWSNGCNNEVFDWCFPCVSLTSWAPLFILTSVKLRSVSWTWTWWYR